MFFCSLFFAAKFFSQRNLFRGWYLGYMCSGGQCVCVCVCVCVCELLLRNFLLKLQHAVTKHSVRIRHLSPSFRYAV
jgi:hypothetical protein